MTTFLTNSIKLYVGYLRPIFYEVCQPDDNYEDCTSGEENDARKSFPSGHSSMSFCGLALLSFFLENQFGVSRLRYWRQDPSTGQVVMSYKRSIRLERIISIFCYAPMVFAGFIATSRIADNKHFPADVVGGAVLGTSVAALVNSLW